MNNLLRGTVITTVRHNTYEYYLCPSAATHGCIYFGKGLKTYLSSIKIYLNDINDNKEYVINCNGRYTYPEHFDEFLKKRDEYKIYNFCNLDSNIVPNSVIMDFAAKYSCKFIGRKFSFRQRGNYCFEIIVKSYIASIKKMNFKMYKFNMIDIYGYKFYNSRSISNYINFCLIYKRYKNKSKYYYYSNCNFIIKKTANILYMESILI
ncbi:NLPc/P60 superfamily protein (Cop-G6R) [Choristoneura biennis entomopoxvirus]|uniref:NLPc/P60 superfamily protein (Cop-G6R) n=1 Tax=Choristoneura biennis entomopoxvirus TaxID=10288 RepID=A0A916P6N7_CBEPV|nr:NLPc/P60 superfamily protein (Cop-G6R) [Choristoneura biennis entomopoxvirus]CCU55650.1 NLPc/P60 superfamily protein (Cop-G6R) [Choristoneura biennis entomopoxvirus]